jgi:hypothetical protein
MQRSACRKRTRSTKFSPNTVATNATGQNDRALAFVVIVSPNCAQKTDFLSSQRDPGRQSSRESRCSSPKSGRTLTTPDVLGHWSRKNGRLLKVLMHDDDRARHLIAIELSNVFS